VRLASVDAMSEFCDLVRPIHAAAAAIMSESEKLASTRDELLPLLMSGKVRVKDSDKVEGTL
jgi:type I restriction enzyme S subunit